MPLRLNYKFILTITPLLAIASMLLNMAITWLLWRNTATVPLWGPSGIALHVLLTGFLQGAVLGWITTKLTRYGLKTKQVLPLHWHLKSQTLIDRLPPRSLHRAFILGLMGLIMTMVVLLMFHLQGIEFMMVKEFIPFIAILSFMLASGIVVVAIYRAMGDNVYQTLEHTQEV